MSKYQTYELHVISLKTVRLGPREYLHNVILRDWDDGQQVMLDMRLSNPINTITPWKIRVLIEDLPESPPET